MEKLVPFAKSDLNSLLKNRPNESKFGEHVQLIPDFTDIYDSLNSLDVTYVIFGIKEDIGVFANYGHTGTSKAWDATLKVLLNIQSNAFTNANKALILGYLDFSKEMEKVASYDQNNKKHIEKARKKVSKIDKYVTDVVYRIVNAGKIPIIIGGGHNNSYGNLKGTALALKKPINVVNFDAHSDFRPEEGRHSGNGFSYAYTEGFLKNYFIFGLHENYTPAVIFKTLDKFRAIQYNTFEAISIRNEHTFKSELQRASEFISQKAFGIEVDCDAIKNIPSSAMTPSGYSVKKARAFVNHFGQQKKAKYLHVCEATPTPDTDIKVGKLITYLITDFMRSNQSIHETH